MARTTHRAQRILLVFLAQNAQNVKTVALEHRAQSAHHALEFAVLEPNNI
jgi:hypothetical protein